MVVQGSPTSPILILFTEVVSRESIIFQKKIALQMTIFC